MFTHHYTKNLYQIKYKYTKYVSLTGTIITYHTIFEIDVNFYMKSEYKQAAYTKYVWSDLKTEIYLDIRHYRDIV